MPFPHEPARMTNAVSGIGDLAATLDRLIEDRPVAMFDWPTHANAGDHFIWLGEKVVLRRRRRVEVLYECSVLNVNFNDMHDLPPATIFVMHGGGNMGDLYLLPQRMREAIIAGFPDRRIIVMPQTVYFRDSEQRDHFARIASGHPDLHLIARDRESFEVLTTQMRLANTYLHTDSAFALQQIVVSLSEFMGGEPTRDVLHLFRRDGEATEASLQRAGSVDWLARASLVESGPAFAYIDIARESFDSEFDALSWGRLCGAVRLFNTAERIVTDRLHGHILASMMGKEHALYDNNYGKNSAFVRTWSHADPLLKMMDARE